MKIFITGGTGFIGRNLKEQLSDNYNLNSAVGHRLTHRIADAFGNIRRIGEDKFDRSERKSRGII